MSDDVAETSQETTQETPTETTPAADSPNDAAKDSVDEKKEEKDGAPPPPEPRVAGKMALLLAREQKHVERTKRERSELQQEQARIASEREELAAIRKKYEAIKTDPLKALEEAGLSYEELTRRILNNGQPSTENELQELKNEVQAFKKEREAQAAAEKAKASEQTIAEVKQQFVSHISANESSYPYLACHDEAEIREAAWAVATQYYARTKEVPDTKEVLDFLETQVESKYKKFEERRQQRTGAPPTQNGTKPKANGSASEASESRGSRTLSASKASERSALPPDVSKLPPEDQHRVLSDFLARNLWRE